MTSPAERGRGVRGRRTDRRRCRPGLRTRPWERGVGQVGRERLRGEGLGVVEALAVLAAHREQLVDLRRALDSFGDGAQLQRGAELGDGLHERPVLGPPVQAGDEGTVDLQGVDGELLEIGQRRVAGAEVVEGELHAQLLDLAQPAQRRVGVVQEQGLGDLEDQYGWIETALGEGRGDVVGDLSRHDLPGGEVDVDPQRAARVGPGAGLPARFGQDPAPHGHDEPGLLGQADEVVGADESPLRVLPAQQRLDAGDLPRTQLEDRLVVQDELLFGEGALQVGAQVPAGELGGVVARGEHLDPVLAVRLGPVHRDVGGPQQVGGRLAAAARRRDPDAGRHDQLLVLQLHLGGERGEDAGGHLLGALRTAGSRQQDRELVPAQAAHRVRRSYAALQPPGQDDEQVVARRVAQAVVDGLEVVDVDEQHGEVLAGAAADRFGVAEPVGEQRPVAQPGEGVVQRLMPQALLELLAVGHVAHGQHDALDGRIVQEIVADGLHVAVGAVVVAHPARHERRGVALGHHPQQVVGERGRVLGMHELAHRRPDQDPGRVAEHPAHRRRGIADRAVAVDHADDVRGVLHEGAEVLAGGQRVEETVEGAGGVTELVVGVDVDA
ncbi:MAG: hypothetical protein M3P96_07150 [Actinomycetota bacterium]|nr:hypothetical protein [Actinomycetota bacterium]